jgi:integrase
VVLQDQDLVNVIHQIDTLRYAEDVRDYLYLCFLCFTALRRGEILGLRWKDINFVGNQIYVRNNVTFPNGQNDPVVVEPKAGSIGVVHLNSELKSRIEPLKNKGYILPYSSENRDDPMTRSMFTKMFARIKKAVDLKGATSHSFRASYATMLNAHCDHVDPKVIQGALRHKTPDLAIKVYTKENENKTRQAEKEYDEWLASKVSQSTDA